MPRRARHPLAVLGALALVPAAALGALVVVAEGRTPDAVPVPPSTEPASLPAALATPLLSVRRAPSPLATDRREDVLTASAAPLVAGVDDTSCTAFGVDGRPVVGSHTALAVIPASTLKVVVAAVAVEVLGADHVFTTEVRAAAPAGGVVQGDLYLVGGGDPVLSEAWYTQPSAARKRPPIHATSAEALADAIVAAGVTEVTGRVVGDGSRYDDERYPPGWGEGIRGFLDGPPVGALVINDTVSRNERVGSDPAGGAAAVLTALLRERGVRVAGEPAAGVAADVPAAPVLATATSAPLADLVNELLATSDNLAAEMLVKELGVAAGTGGTRAAGLQVIHDRLAEWGVPMEGVTLTDGSGLSRDNQVTCNALLAVLRRGSAADAIGAGMAVAGQDGTTLEGRLDGVGIAGVLRGKTGTLTGVRALCGYFPAGDDEIAFVLVLNGPTATDYVTAWTRLTDALLAAATTPTATALAPA